MIFLATFAALFIQMYRLARQGYTHEQAAALAELDRPFADDAKVVLEAATDGGLYLLRGVFALVMWLLGLANKALGRVFSRSFSERAEQFAQWVCKVCGAGFDPNGSTLPVWETREAKPFKILVDEYVEEDGGNFVVYDGVAYNGRFAGEKKEMRITRAEMEALRNYDPPLLNASLAGKVKGHLQEGKSDYEMAVLTGYAESTVKHYRLAIEKAAKNT